jgi:hypothetical protein
LVTKTSRLVLAEPVRLNAPREVGKSGDWVAPATYLLPAASTAMPSPLSSPDRRAAL